MHCVWGIQIAPSWVTPLYQTLGEEAPEMGVSRVFRLQVSCTDFPSISLVLAGCKIPRDFHPQARCLHLTSPASSPVAGPPSWPSIFSLLFPSLSLSLSPYSLLIFYILNIKLKVLELNFNVILNTQIPSSRTLVLNLVPNARMCSILFDQTLKLYHINTVHLVGVPYPIIIIFKFF